MQIVHYPEGLPLAEYLQIEQDLVREVQEPTLFTWIVPPTVIYGRHQSAEVEVNEAYCAEHGIAVVQRNAQFMQILSGALHRLGYDAVTTAHNDILVGERKVSGTACYITPTGTVVHACMLYQVNLEALEKAITPTAAKLAKHAVASVRQRVRNLGDIRDLGDIAAFRELLEKQL